MWKLLESKTALKQLKKCPGQIKEEYEGWKKIIEFSGPQALKEIRGYRDHALKGEWKGARSSSLSKKWRVIYHIDKREIIVFILEVNPHDYRKKT
ncbi:MAG: type II toxin-antitoxin system mRNA interferase toxin, RelE/StbE family [Bacteriovoracales bacterium]|nr:type II toxin-antitoxin system mRNA interferase toxin, RelE/StbE family [Bacteriovoracales bacterium]